MDFLPICRIYIFGKNTSEGSEQINLSIKKNTYTQRNEWIYAIALGLLIGLISTAKIINVFLLLFVFILPKKKQKIAAISSFVFSCFLFTIPIISNYKRAAQFWLLAGASNGEYQKWNMGFIGKFHDSIVNLQSLIEQEPIFFILFLLCLIGYLFILLQKPKIFSANQLTLTNNPVGATQNSLNKILLVCILSLGFAFIQLILAIKHPYARYLIVSMILLGFTLYLEIYSCQLLGLFKAINFKFLNISTFDKSISFWLPFNPALWLSLSGILFAVSCTQFSISFQRASHYRLSTESFIGNIKKQYLSLKTNNCKTILYDQASEEVYALYFGNNFPGAYFSRYLFELYPSQVFYNQSRRMFSKFNGEIIQLEQFKKIDSLQNKCLVMQGTRFDEDGLYFAKYKPSFPIKLIVRNYEEGVYLIHGTSKNPRRTNTKMRSKYDTKKFN